MGDWKGTIVGVCVCVARGAGVGWCWWCNVADAGRDCCNLPEKHEQERERDKRQGAN